MEVVEACPKRKAVASTKACPCNTKCVKRYVQPPRVKSFAPERVYRAPSKRLETGTTYHLSYLSVDRAAARYARTKPIRPVHSFGRSSGKFFDDTTSKLSYRPVWQIVKPEPIVPIRRPLMGQGSMETVTTIRHDYGAKYVERPEMIIPCGSIRTSTVPLEDRTMTRLSYICPGSVEPAISFKPMLKYCSPSQPFSKETTQKLSYQPIVVDKTKDFYPWAQKPVYKQPDIAMCGKTTYSQSYIENDAICVVRPILPIAAYVFPHDAQFADKTVYKESYLPGDATPAKPIVPCGSISIPDVRMSADTTTKLSYQQVRAEKRRPIVPCGRSMLGIGAMQSETTTRREYAAKAAPRPDLIVPCDNIRSADAPLESGTTTGLSYIKPGAMEPVHSYKPVTQYCRPEIKLDSETISKLSYQTWTPKPKEELPWAQRGKYRLPAQPMVGDTIYHMSFPAPGHYVEDDTCADSPCPCPDDK